jgi:hypothetical protein
MLTDLKVQRAKARDKDYWLVDETTERGVGRLVLRVKAGVGTRRWYFRYTDANGKRVHLPIGSYGDREGEYTLAKARAERDRLKAIHQKAETRDVRAAERERVEAKQRADAAAKRERETRANRTLQALLDAYTAHLKKQGKPSHADVANIVKNHVTGTTYAGVRADEITSRDVAALLRRLTEAGKGVTARKLRAAIRAAYALAVRAELDPAVSSDLVAFAVTSNPASDTGSLSSYSKPRDRVLTEGELKALIEAIDAESRDLVRWALRLNVFLAGQRIKQLLRVRVSDVDLQARTITLFDPKGRRAQPRPHALPLTAPALELATAARERAVAAKRELLFGGLVSDTPSKAVTAIAADLVKRKVIERPFALNDLRRTCETMLAALGISKDIRAQLQSHGLGGVQARHYDRHEYMNEKRAALEAWADRIDEIVTGKQRTNVEQLDAARKKRARKTG